MNNKRHSSPASMKLLLEDIITRYDRYGFPTESSVYAFNREVYKKHGYGIPLDPNMISARKVLVACLKSKKIPKWMKEMPTLGDTFSRVANKYETGQKKGKRKSPFGEDGQEVIGIFAVNPVQGSVPPEKRPSLEKPGVRETPAQIIDTIVPEPMKKNGVTVAVVPSQKRRSDPTEKPISLGQSLKHILNPLPKPEDLKLRAQSTHLFQKITDTKENYVLQLEKKIQDQNDQIKNQATQIEIGNIVNQERERAISRLREDVEQLKIQISRSETETAETKNVLHNQQISQLIASLKSQLASKSQLFDDVQLRSNELEKKVKILEGQLMESKAEIWKKENERQQDKSRTEKLVHQLKHTENRKRDDVVQLEEKIRGLETAKNEVTALLEKKTNEHESERLRADELQRRMKESEERIKELEKRVSTLLMKARHLADTSRSVNLLKKQKEDEIRSLKGALIVKRQSIEQLSSYFELCKERNALLEEKMTSKEAEVELLKKHLADTTVCLKQTNQSNEEFRAELDKLSETERALRSNLVMLTDELQSLKDRLEEVQNKHAEESSFLKRELEEKIREIASLEEKISDSQKEANENLSDLQSKIASLQLAIKNKTGMSGPDTLTGDHEDKVQELMTIISDLETQHRKELQELEDSLQTSRNTIEIYKQTTKNQEDVISILQANGHHSSLPNTPMTYSRPGSHSSRRKTTTNIPIEIEID